MLVLIHGKIMLGLSHTHTQKKKKNGKNTLLDKESKVLQIRKQSNKIRITRTQTQLDPAKQII